MRMVVTPNNTEANVNILENVRQGTGMDTVRRPTLLNLLHRVEVHAAEEK